MRKELTLDWISILLYAFFVLFGWVNIYAASTNDASLDLFNMSENYGRQFVFIVISVVVGISIFRFTEPRDIEFLSYIFYGATLLLIILTLVAGVEVSGAKAWIELGFTRLQPAEFAKIGLALALAKYMSEPGFSWNRLRDRVMVLALCGVPFVLILLQNDTGTALVFFGVVFMLYREGLSGVYLLLIFFTGMFGVMTFILEQNTILNLIAMLAMGAYISYAQLKRWQLHLLLLLVINFTLLWLINTEPIAWEIFGTTLTDAHLLLAVNVLLLAGYVFYLSLNRFKSWLVFTVLLIGYSTLVIGIDFVFTTFLKPYQQNRIIALFDPDFDPSGVNWNSTQSKIAIGSGGLSGKGFLEGTQTKFDFVPQQHTDFIFCTIGEEWGWLGTTVVLLLFLGFMAQLLYIAEESRSVFARVYGYAVVGMFFMHVAINVAMTIGLAPVIGIPLPFFSFGGSSMLSFSLMLFILLVFYAHRQNVLGNSLRR